MWIECFIVQCLFGTFSVCVYINYNTVSYKKVVRKGSIYFVMGVVYAIIIFLVHLKIR
jgi:hypothetical protein